MAELDEIDKEILRLLQKDARTPYKDIAEKIGKAPATVKNRITRMIQIGIIKRFIPLLDHKRLGYGLTALIMIQAKPGKLNELGSFIEKEQNIISAYEVTGEYDFAVVGRFRNEEGLASFIRRILDTGLIERTVTSMILKIYKEDPRLPIQ
ncbi:MAG: AsnC family transcriptional regulator [Candidatus Latescibacterota bacterium]|nr:Lrp/AsnC family transcriptional regulator [Candidatus Korarchaeota archaeon]RKY63058.1 MAG: AsnC family transcriptional regulator [Candidatus Latescibacterota bacterium]